MALNSRITDWRGQHVWLIGASTGIGRATAALLHRRGAQVTLSARSAVALDAFVAEHPGAQALALDATDAAAVHAAALALLQQHGRIDLAMYCAGHYRAMTAMDFDLADALRHQQVNVVGALNLLDAVLPPLLPPCCPRCCARPLPAPQPTSAWWPAWPATAACPTRWLTAPPRPR